MLNVKYKIEKAALKQVLGYLKKNPEENLEKIIHWVRKFDTADCFAGSSGIDSPVGTVIVT